ncbi:MAG: lysophospholipid acyltransferase family protein [Propionibacteriaceae bacterium]|nr:lysophospholipid acyltransferase family protein [Propionibacteriaceae bacterium]
MPLRTPSAPGDGPVYRRLAKGAGVVLRAVSREVWDDADQLPATGGMILVSNHVSYADVLAVGRYVIWSGRWPRYLGKAELWSTPVVGWFARKCGQIPVLRNSMQARDALAPALAALERGECVGIYPEGGRTRDPDLWPQMARTGVARLALATGVPVIPTANWGTHQIMPGRKLTWPRLFPRKRVEVMMGDPVDLDDLHGRTDVEAMRLATGRIMDAVTALVEQLRGEERPEGIWDPRAGERVPRRT